MDYTKHKMEIEREYQSQKVQVETEILALMDETLAKEGSGEELKKEFRQRSIELQKLLIDIATHENEASREIIAEKKAAGVKLTQEEKAALMASGLVRLASRFGTFAYGKAKKQMENERKETEI